jgi:hypothetical protein
MMTTVNHVRLNLSSETRIWRYVVAVDAGIAPCPYHRMLTLCICKPRIRKNARAGDLVIGFAPKRYGHHLVVWAGRVDEKVPMGEYWRGHSKRPDAIYQLQGHDPDGREILWHDGGELHQDVDAIARDKRGKNTLIFRPYWYWGRNAQHIPSNLQDLVYHYVGQTTKGVEPRHLRALEHWLSAWTPGSHGVFRDKELRTCDHP